MKNDSLHTVQVIETEVYSRVVGYYRNSLKSALKMVG